MGTIIYDPTGDVPCNFPCFSPIKHLTIHSFKKHQLTWNCCVRSYAKCGRYKMNKIQAIPEGTCSLVGKTDIHQTIGLPAQGSHGEMPRAL